MLAVALPWTEPRRQLYDDHHSRAVLSLLLALPTVAAADVIDCSGVSRAFAFVDPPRSAPVLHFVDALPFSVRSFGAPTIDYTAAGNYVQVVIHQTLLTAKSDTAPTCHQETLALPPVSASTQYDVTCVYQVTDDGGAVSTRSVGVVVTGLDWNPVTLTATPAAPTNQTPIQIAIDGFTPNSSQLMAPLRVTVDGSRINIDVEVAMGGTTTIGRYDGTVNLGFLPPGEYVVTSASRTFVDSVVWPSFCDTAELRLSVTAVPRPHAVRH